MIPAVPQNIAGPHCCGGRLPPLFGRRPANGVDDRVGDGELQRHVATYYTIQPLVELYKGCMVVLNVS